MQVCKNSANERKVSLLTICRMPPILYKDIKDIGKKVYFYGVT